MVFVGAMAVISTIVPMRYWARVMVAGGDVRSAEATGRVVEVISRATTPIIRRASRKQRTEFGMRKDTSRVRRKNHFAAATRIGTCYNVAGDEILCPQAWCGRPGRSQPALRAEVFPQLRRGSERWPARCRVRPARPRPRHSGRRQRKDTDARLSGGENDRVRNSPGIDSSADLHA